MENTFIYVLIDPISSKIRYVGKTNNTRNRIYAHMKECYNTPTYKNNWIKSLLAKNLKPTIEILDEVPNSEWEFWERYWISQLKIWGIDLTNSTLGGAGPENYSHRKSSRLKMRRSKLGIPLSESHKEKISNSVKNKFKENPNYNKCHDIHIFLNKDILYQKYIVENLSIPQLSELLNLTESVIFRNLKIFNIEKDKSIWKNQCASKPKKPVLQYDLSKNFVREWSSIIEIKKKLGYDVSKCCRGEAKTIHGQIWRYKDNPIDLEKSNHIIRTKSVNQFDKNENLLNKFNSLKEAARETKISDKNIGACCQGKVKSAGGFIWKYSIS